MTQPPTPPKKHTALIGLFKTFDRTQKRAFALMFVVLLISSFVMLGFGTLLRGLVDQGFVAANMAHLNHSLYIMLSLICVLAAASFGRLAIAAWLAEDIAAKLHAKVFAHLLGLGRDFYNTRKSTEISSGISADLSAIATIIATTLPMLGRHSIMAIGGITMLVFTSAHLTLLVGLTLPLVLLPVIFIGRKLRARSSRAQTDSATLGGFVGEALGAITTLQSYNAQAPFLSRFAQTSTEATHSKRAQDLTRAMMVGCIILIVFAALCGVMWVGARDVILGNMSAGDLTSFVFYAAIVAAAFGVLGDMGSALFRASASIERINDILAQKPAIYADAALPDAPNSGDITIDNLSFAHACAETTLQNINMHIKTGQVIGIVGASGAGKTTLFDLLMRFYTPNDGRILLGGADIAGLNLDSLRARMAYVPQDGPLFSFSVRDNIRLGDMSATDEAVIQAAKQAQAHDFIMQLPQGYDTPLGERGTRLSGGQRARIALARALIKPAPILLLDEATAALDSTNEALVQNAIQSLQGTRTVLVIAHRLSTIMAADTIYVMQDGRIVEQGTHAELLANAGAYAKLHNKQHTAA